MRNRPVVALVPIRSPGVGKTRLAAAGLSPTQRATLSAAMLADVTGALRHADVDSIVVAAAGDEAAAAAAALNLDVLIDPPDTTTLDAAVASAAARIRAAGSLLVVMADLPRLMPEEIDELLSGDAPVVVAPTADGGTGALLRTPPQVIATAYGPQSAHRHLRLADEAGISAQMVRLDGLRHDIDTIDDLEELRNGPVGPATRHVLPSLLDVADPPA